MDELNLFIINTHQVFWSLITLFIGVLLFQDRHEITASSDVNQRKNFTIICIGIFIGSFVTLFYSWGFEGLFFSIEFALLITFSVIRPKYAVSFLIFLLLSRPWETYHNQMMESMPRDISYLVLLSVVGHKIIKKDFSIRFNTGTLSLLIFALWMLLSAVTAAHSETAVTEYINILSKGIIVFLLIQNSISHPKDLLGIKAALVIAIVEKMTISLYRNHLIDTGILVELGDRLTSVGILSNSNDIAAIFVLAVPFVLFFILKTRLKPMSWIFGAIVTCLMAYLIWQAQSRGAVLGLALSMGSWYLVKVKNRKVLFGIAMACLLGAMGVVKLMSRSSSDLDDSQSNRIVFIKAGINMAIRNPLFGVGYWGFNDNLSSYILSGDSATESNMSAHSSWVLALAEGGFIGLFSFMSLWIYAFICAFKIRVLEPEYLMAIVGYGVTCTFLSHTYLLYPYILLGLVITHFHMIKESNQLPKTI